MPIIAFAPLVPGISSRCFSFCVIISKGLKSGMSCDFEEIVLRWPHSVLEHIPYVELKCPRASSKEEMDDNSRGDSAPSLSRLLMHILQVNSQYRSFDSITRHVRYKAFGSSLDP